MKKNKSLYMKKLSLYDLNNLVNNKGLNIKDVFIAIPDREKDYNIFHKIWLGDFKATISHIRILGKHKRFFKIISIAVENGILEKIPVKNENISIITIQRLRDRFKKDLEVFRYILKWLFLPLDEVLLPDGKIHYLVSSQAFDELDEILADEFFNKSYDFICDMFDINRSELNNWS